jgi:LysM repeat protein
MQIESIYSFEPGDTLRKVAQKHNIRLLDLLFANQQVTTQDSIQIGEEILIPVKPVKAPVKDWSNYDGTVPAPGTISMRRASYIDPPLKNNLSNRSRDAYDQLINQFAVGHNPRYLPGDGRTWCNIFVWDITTAMGCELPHWLDRTGRAAIPYSSGANEVNINGGIDWMINQGVRYNGWRKASSTEAQQAANLGQMALALWKNPTGHGHTAVVRPGNITSEGPASAQAGRRNFNSGHIKNGFGELVPDYYIHA